MGHEVSEKRFETDSNMLLPSISTKNSKHNSNVAFRKQVSREVNHVLRPPVFTNGCLQASPKYSLIEKSH